ncbi:kinase-like protein [Biscogniauxia mediterranea]|nr:kinase-like protein [Biscogniauxia mediterranea]
MALAKTDHIQSLRRQLQNSMVESESRRNFIPDISIVSILTLRTIKEIIPNLNCKPDELIGLAERIHHDGRKTFAILVLMGEEDYIVKFRDHNLLDDRLPLSKESAQAVAGDVGTNFTKRQWELLPVTFQARMWENHQEFGMEKILPFIDDPEPVGEGGFGEVVRIKILPSQQAFYPQDSDEVQVIRKRLKSTEVTRAFHNEKMLLRLLNQLQHPNIIRLLGSYTHRREHYFLFPCVDMDLKRFFQQGDRFGKFRWDFTFYSALRGLSNALSMAHALRLTHEPHGVDFQAIGYHHDIRPANVLVSQNTFLLADFGLGNLKPADAQSLTPLKSEQGDWLAPECMDENHVSRAIDVWAFGCLMTEVATYMRKGAAGVKVFSDRRLSERRPRWVDSMFYRQDGVVKGEVKEWLETLASDESDDHLLSSLVQLSLQALERDIQLRPKITDICDKLTLLSMRAHSVAVQQEFHKYLRLVLTPEVHNSTTTNNVWFLQERFRAWEHALTLNTTKPSADLLKTLHGIHDKSTNIMADLVYQLETRRKDKKVIDGSAMAAEDADALYDFESRIDQLVESLWDFLPPTLQRHAQDYWHQAIFCTDSQGDLDGVQQTLKSRYTVYDIADAMAKMRKIRLELLRPDSFESATDACTIAMGDIKFTSKDGQHALGLYKDSVPILVERMPHTPAWDAVDPEQRKLVVGLKAKSLSANPKPSGLRVMECIGAFEENGNRVGYGFVYRYPEGTGSAPTTLLQLLNEGETGRKARPLLGDKFYLAFALADFLKEFHTIGWLHENFTSHNVLFWKPPTAKEANGPAFTHDLRQPFVVGLQKSRPDGSFWQTDGPTSDPALQDYQHPEYANTGRYRQAFDYYGLGILLLEIGLWRPLRSWQSKFQRLDLTEVREELRKICKARLGAAMGVAYRDVTLRCMDGSLEAGIHGKGDVPSDRAAALRSFTETVVQPLEKLALASI